MSATIKQFTPNQLLFKEGDASRCMYLIKKGTVAIRKMKQGAQIEIARIYANEVLGELSFFDRQPRSASAVALTEVEVMEIDFDALDKIYTHVPDYLKTIMAAVAERLRKANETIKRLQKNTVSEAAPDEDESKGLDSSNLDSVLAAAAGAEGGGTPEGGGEPPAA